MNGHGLQVFWSVTIVVGYSIGMFWLGAYVESNQHRVNIAHENRVLLLENAKANDEILKRLRSCNERS